jgi:hypothetical protein
MGHLIAAGTGMPDYQKYRYAEQAPKETTEPVPVEA